MLVKKENKNAHQLETKLQKCSIIIQKCVRTLFLNGIFCKKKQIHQKEKSKK